MVVDASKELSTHQKVLSAIEDFGCISYSGIQRAVYRKFGVFLPKRDISAVVYYLKRTEKIFQVGSVLCSAKEITKRK